METSQNQWQTIVRLSKSYVTSVVRRHTPGHTIRLPGQFPLTNRHIASGTDGHTYQITTEKPWLDTRFSHAESFSSLVFI